jgi:N-acetylglucosamine-6-phosphate deacetylase
MKCIGRDPRTQNLLEVSFDGSIAAVDDVLAGEAGAAFIAPGFIDLQVNGFAGVDYNSPHSPLSEISRSIQVMYSTGVTRFFPTVITGPPEDMVGALRNLAAAKEALEEGEAMEGFHVEGPHISPEDGPRGAHPARWVRRPDINEFRRWQEAARGNVRLVTLSPEWPEAPSYTETLVSEGVVVSIGHTRASAEKIQSCVSAGATLSTHIGNGAHSVLERHPNYIWEQLAQDRLAASFIVDGIHLGPSFLKVALRAKGIERAVLITDAVMPAMCPPGEYRLGEIEVELHADDSVRLKGGTRLAGSSLRMDRGVGNLMRIAGLSLNEALAMATVNPARVGRIRSRQRGLSVGERADFVLFAVNQQENRIEVRETWASGKLVYSSANPTKLN